MISLPWISQLHGSGPVHTVAPPTASSRIPAHGRPYATSLQIKEVRQTLSTNTGSTARNVTRLSTRISTGFIFPCTGHKFSMIPSLRISRNLSLLNTIRRSNHMDSINISSDAKKSTL